MVTGYGTHQLIIYLIHKLGIHGTPNQRYRNVYFVFILRLDELSNHILCQIDIISLFIHILGAAHCEWKLFIGAVCVSFCDTHAHVLIYLLLQRYFYYKFNLYCSISYHFHTCCTMQLFPFIFSNQRLCCRTYQPKETVWILTMTLTLKSSSLTSWGFNYANQQIMMKNWDSGTKLKTDNCVWGILWLEACLMIISREWTNRTKISHRQLNHYYL